MLEKYDSSKNSKNEWLLFSVSFTAKFGLVFVLALEILGGFIFKPIETVLEIFKIALRLRNRHVFM